MTKIVYKIRRRRDGLFSTGGSWPNFKAKGKQWVSAGALHAHLNIVEFKHYADCELIKIKVEEAEMPGALDVNSYQRDRARQLQEVAAEKERKRQARIPRCEACHQPLGKGHAHGGK